MVCDSSLAQKYRVYVGTYTGGDSEGIYSFDFDSSTGATTPVKLVAEATNPSFLAVHPSGKYLFSVNETGEFDGQKSGGLTAFAVDPVSGELKFLPRFLNDSIQLSGRHYQHPNPLGIVRPYPH